MADTGFKYDFFKHKDLSDETIDTYITYFDMFKKDKKLLQKDIYSFNEDELTQALLKIKSKSTLLVVSSILKQYLEYAYARKKTNKLYNIYEIIEKNNIDSKIKNMEMFQGYIVSRDELYQLVNHVIFNRRDAAIFVLLYEGLTNDEVINLKINQVDFVNNCIIINKNKVFENIDKRSMEVIKYAIEETECYDSNGKSTAKNPITPLSTEGNYVIKVGIRQNNNRTYQVLSVPIRNMQREICKLMISASRIRTSGMFDHIRSMEYKLKRKLTKDELKNIVLKYGYVDENPLNTNNHLSKTRTNYNDFLNILRPSDEDLKLFEEQHFAEEKIKEKAKKSIKNRIMQGKKRSQKADKNTWIDDNDKIGKKGEKIALIYLQETYGKENAIEINDKDDFDGYDILLMTDKITERIEVKTTRKLYSPIHISINQLGKADMYKGEFCIYIVYNPLLKEEEELTDEVIRKSKIYKVQNPIDIFEIDVKALKKILQFKNCFLETDKFKMTIDKAYIDNIEPLEFKERTDIP